MSRRKRRLDNIIVIDGEEGAGKSTLAKRLVEEIGEGAVLIETEADWDREMKDQREGLIVVIDEGERLALSRDWNMSFNRRLIKLMMQIRFLGWTVIICIPNLRWLDVYLREHRIHFRIHVVGRGFAVVQERRENWRKLEIYFKDIAELEWDPYAESEASWVEHIASKKRGLTATLSNKNGLVGGDVRLLEPDPHQRGGQTPRDARRPEAKVRVPVKKRTRPKAGRR